jgi:hypothetical protein
MIDKFLRVFSKIGNGFIGLFIKIMVVLIILVIIIATVQGVISHWALVLSLLIGMLFSPLFYREVSKKFKFEFPEFFTWGITDVIDTLIPNEETFTTLRNELKQKQTAAVKVASEMETMADVLEQSAHIFIKERKLRSLTKTNIKGPVTARMRKVMSMQLDDEEGEVMRSLHDKRQEINWDKYL